MKKETTKSARLDSLLREIDKVLSRNVPSDYAGTEKIQQKKKKSEKK